MTNSVPCVPRGAVFFMIGFSTRQFPGVQLGQAIGLDLGIEPGLDAGESVLAQPARFLRVVDQRDDGVA